MSGSDGDATAKRILLTLGAFVLGAILLLRLMGSFLPPSPQAPGVPGDTPPATEEESISVLVLPLEAVESSDAAGTAARIHALLVAGIREGEGVRVAAGEASAPPGSGRRGGTGVQGVQAVLAGDVVHDGERIRLTLRLTAAPGGDLLWTGSYEGRPGAGDELARTAARSVSGELALYAEVLREEEGNPDA